MNLSEKYRPHRIAEFVDLTKPRRSCKGWPQLLLEATGFL